MDSLFKSSTWLPTYCYTKCQHSLSGHESMEYQWGYAICSLVIAYFYLPIAHWLCFLLIVYCYLHVPVGTPYINEEVKSNVLLLFHSMIVNCLQFQNFAWKRFPNEIALLVIFLFHPWSVLSLILLTKSSNTLFFFNLFLCLYDNL